MFAKKLIFSFALSFIILGTRSDDVAELKKLLDYKIKQLKEHFESNLVLVNQKIEHLTKNATSESCDGDWFAFSDTKCFKVLEKKGSELEAKANCSQVDSSSTLITIESKAEQDFLSNQLKKYKTVSTYVWMGLEFIDKSFKWIDGKDFKYQNWGENAVKDGSSKCVQMSLVESDLGKWTDDSCQKKYLFVCQKKQSTKTVLSQEVENITKVIQKQQDTINKQQITINSQQDSIKNFEKVKGELKEEFNKVKGNLLPIGFIYTQLPNQSAPGLLWPKTKWTEVTANYSGLFFRAEGGESESFGQIQNANQSWISNVRYQGCYNTVRQSGQILCYPGDNSTLHHGKFTNVVNKDVTELHILEFFTTKGEVRPENTAIKIWKRTE